MTLDLDAFRQQANRFNRPSRQEYWLEDVLRENSIPFAAMERVGLLVRWQGPTSEVNTYQMTERGSDLLRFGQGMNAFVVLEGKRPELLKMLEGQEGDCSSEIYTERLIDDVLDSETELQESGLSPVRRNILKAMESILANECYNASIENYGPNGAREAPGRAFRYPVTIRTRDGTKTKVRDHTIPKQFTDNELRSAYYSFGANQIDVMAAMEKILAYLAKNHELKLP